MVLRSMKSVSCDRPQRSIIRAKSQPKVNSTLSIDLSQNWVNATVTIHSTTKPNGLPNVEWGSLWYDESTELLYTGYTGVTFSLLGGERSTSPSSIWTFKPDNLGGGIWNQRISPNASVWNIIQPSYAGYQAYGNGSAYVLDGMSAYGNGSTHVLDGMSEVGSAPPLSGMIKFDMSSQYFSNISSETGATSPSGNPAYGGAMQYVPFFGSNGVFVVMGGDDENGDIDFVTVLIYDPASGAWYKQTTTGNVPRSRSYFCTAGAASTNDTYEIFVYAGSIRNSPLDTVHILSLPAFNWFSGANTTQYPRVAHTCEAVGGGQIVIIGGYDAAPFGGPLWEEIHAAGSYLATPDPFAQGLAIFDLRTLDFAAEYLAGGGAVYEPNETITQFYALGSYSENLVEGVTQLMKETHFPPSTSSNSTASNSSFTSPSSSSPPNSPHTNHAGAMAGGVIGGSLGIALIIALMLWLLRRRGRRMQARLSQNPAEELGNREAHEKDGNARAELPQPFSRLELGYGEAHEKDGIARLELGFGEAHEKDGNARAELPG